MDGFLIEDGVLVAYGSKERVAVVPEGVEIIGPGAFKGCVSLEEVVLPQSLMRIEDNGFKGCRKLCRINFPAKLNFIGEYAFYRCHSLEQVALPMGVTYLGSCAFLFCDNLVSVAMPGVKALGTQAFFNDVNLKDILVAEDLDQSGLCDVFTGCCQLNRITLAGGEVFLLDDVMEMLSSRVVVHPLVAAIVYDAFRMMEIQDGVLMKFLTNVKHMKIPSGLKGIGNGCFYDKKGMFSVELPATVEMIGSKAFRNCINLEQVTFGSEAVVIHHDAFKNCTTLRQITLPGGRTYALSGVPENLDHNLPPVVRIIHGQILSNFLISGSMLIRYRGSEERVVVPEGITVVGEGAFAGNEAIDRVILPDSLKEIQEGAFADCLLLQSINLPEGLGYLGRSAFENCVKLIRIALPETITKLEKSTFNRCKRLNEVHFSSHLKEIGDQVFYGCQSLKNVHLPNQLRRIGDLAFYQCGGLKEIVLPKSLMVLGSNVFTGSGLRWATIEGNIQSCGTGVFSQCGKLRQLNFEEGVEAIGDKFASSCPNLKIVNLPGTLAYLGRDTFGDSPYHEAVMKDGAIGSIFYDGGQFVGEVVIPEGIKAIAGGAFYGNTKITGLVLPASLQRIGDRAFCGCIALREVTLPQGVTELAEGVFAYCPALERVKTLGVIAVIGDNAFYGGQALVQVPVAGALEIGKNAFHGCKALAELEIYSTKIGENAFRQTAFLTQLANGSPLVRVADALVDGGGCKGQVHIPEGVRFIVPFAFAGNENLFLVVLPKSLVAIGEGAFLGCKNLASVVFQDELEFIGAQAFEKCLALVDLSVRVKNLGDRAFAYCLSLKQALVENLVNFGAEVFVGCSALVYCSCPGLERIGDGCFSGARALADFDLQEVRIIGQYAFWGCDALTELVFAPGTLVGAHGFEDCGHLRAITVPKEGLSYESYAFSGCTAMAEVTLDGQIFKTAHYGALFDLAVPNLVKALYANALSCFEIDEDLTLLSYSNQGRFVQIPPGIKGIGRDVFRNAMNLEEILVPKSVDKIGSRAFWGTLWLETQKALTPLVVVNHILVDATNSEGDVVVPAEITRISGWAFSNNYTLTGLTLSSERTIVEKNAFRNCINLKRVTTGLGETFYLKGLGDRQRELPLLVTQIAQACLYCFKTDQDDVLVECTGNITDLVLAEGIKAIGEEVFQESNLLTHLTLARETVAIGAGAFEHCKYLVSVDNGSRVQRIGNKAFSGCTMLERVTFSTELMEIGSKAFEHCSSLEGIVIPEGVTEIPARAFYRCKCLKNLTLPSTLKSIGQEAFAFCSELGELDFPIGLEKIEARAFAWCPNLESKGLLASVAIHPDAFGGET